MPNQALLNRCKLNDVVKSWSLFVLGICFLFIGFSWHRVFGVVGVVFLMYSIILCSKVRAEAPLVTSDIHVCTMCDVGVHMYSRMFDEFSIVILASPPVMTTASS